ncbi:15100_t:CDS:2 [Dentiscutata heterogama]|uniref:15100_t:CDS:1 n=1 Tax=Dentiscutata heterogama TaxID=1316150 RepID=A0ACA9LCC9_9GLOM|nr:15100_t:CDS:2 [Dentiscutata heterogama]
MQFTSGFVFPEAVSQTPVALNPDFTFTCSPGGAPLNSLSPLPLGMPPTDELDIPEFFQYSKEKYESQKMGCGRRRKSSRDEHFDNSSLDGDDIDDTSSTMSHAEFRRQIHIQSEQKRRAEIKDGFEELRRQLPTTYTGRKMSKAVLLQKAVSHLKNQSRKESFLLDEINRLSQTCIYLNAELEKEKRMSALYRQKQTLDKIYAIGL